MRPGRRRRAATPTGDRIVQEWGWLGKVAKADRLYVRRITKHLPDGKELGVVTDLLDEVKYPAEAMLATYQSRWGIETVFHQITDVFSLRHLIGTMPKAVLFQLSFCLLLYNALQVVRAPPGVASGMRGEEDFQREAVLRREAADGGGQRVGRGGDRCSRCWARCRRRPSCASICGSGCEAPGAIAGGKHPAPAVAGIRK